MNIYYENSVVTILLEKDNTLIKNTFKKGATAENINENLIKEIMNTQLKATREHKPTKYLIDIRNLNFTLSNVLQDWIMVEIITAKNTIQKVALVASQDIFTQVSIEEIMDEEIANKLYNIQYFESDKEAEAWLG